MTHTWPIVALLLALAVPARSQTAATPGAPIRVALGNVTLSIPPPVGFVDLHAGNDDIKQRFTSNVGQDTLAVHVPAATAAAYQAGQNLGFYTLVRVMQKLRAVDVPAADFDGLANELAAKKMFSSEEFQDYLARSKQRTGITIGKPIDLGVVARTPQSVTTLVILTLESGSQQVTKLTASSTVFLRGRVVFLYMYRDMESPADLKVLQDAALDWVQRTVAANR